MKYRYIIIGGVALILIVGLVALLFGRRGGDSLSGNITMWGFEEPATWERVIGAFESQYGGVSITYQQQSAATYESDLINALAAGRGPDIFVIHRSWLQKHRDKIVPFPEEVFTPSDFRFAFVDVAVKDLIRQGQVWAVPFYVDTLALYYNKDIFNSAGIALPPVTWDEFNQTVEQLVRITEEGTIERAGAAIGTAQNVTYAADILQALMLQTGTQMVSQDQRRATFDAVERGQEEQFSPGEGALVYYTSFSNPTTPLYTWNRRIDTDQTAFVQGSAAMYLGYARDRDELESSNISVGVAPLPQVEDAKEDPSYTNVTYADYWAGAVNKVSPAREAAWSFLQFATSRNALFTFLNAAELPTPRRDLVEVQSRDEEMRIFSRQALSADSWPEPDHERITALFGNMIEDVVLGRLLPNEALGQTADIVTVLLQQR